MLYYIYDNSYEGLLTAVFEAFSRKELPDRIVGEKESIPLFTDTFNVITDDRKAIRVSEGLQKKLSPSAFSMLSICFLSELPDIEVRIFNYITKSFASPISIELNFADDDVLTLSQVYKKVVWESTRMKQFVRFQKTADGLFFALIDPQYDVLPLCYDFFEDRYADQAWIIYDKKRKYGVHYNKEKSEIVYFDKLNISLETGKLTDDQSDETEQTFQALWKDYIKAITIQQRKNLRLQRHHMPKRYWKYLTEKQ